MAIASIARSTWRHGNVDFWVPAGTPIRMAGGPHYLRDDNGVDTEIEIFNIPFRTETTESPDRYGRRKPIETQISAHVLRPKKRRAPAKKK